MSIIEAVYRNGVFEPLQPVQLPEGERVTAQVPNGVAAATPEAKPDWLVRLNKRHDELRAKYGVLPDSTPLIREDRDRDI